MPLTMRPSSAMGRRSERAKSSSMHSPPAPVSMRAWTFFRGRSGDAPGAERDLRPTSTRMVGPTRSRRSAALSVPRPALKPVWTVRMRRLEDHPAAEMDRAGADLADEVRPKVEPFERRFRGALEVREHAFEPAAEEHHPFLQVLGLQLATHAFECRDVVLQYAHEPSRLL